MDAIMKTKDLEITSLRMQMTQLTSDYRFKVKVGGCIATVHSTAGHAMHNLPTSSRRDPQTSSPHTCQVLEQRDDDVKQLKGIIMKLKTAIEERDDVGGSTVVLVLMLLGLPFPARPCTSRPLAAAPTARRAKPSEAL
jgi:hypothetical protein